MEIEYWRNRHQRMNFERFCAANTIALVTHAITQPMDLVKVRSQLLQEGKPFNGLFFQKGFSPSRVFNEIHATGCGVRGMFCGMDGWLTRTIGYTTARLWGFLYFYDKINPDPRRNARIDWHIMAGTAGGLVAGVLTNPIELVYTRMQADALYPEAYKRNYRSFAHGIGKAIDEGVLMRGALANGLKLSALLVSMSHANDWMKENAYFHLGPNWINRLLATSLAVSCGVAASMPFDNIKTRMHTMRPLPTGKMPYTSTWDCFKKICFYECNTTHSSNAAGSFYTGGQAYFARLFFICYASQFILDYYHGTSAYVSEFWQPARFSYQSGIDYDIHEPFTDAFNKMMAINTHITNEAPEMMPSGEGSYTSL